MSHPAIAPNVRSGSPRSLHMGGRWPEGSEGADRNRQTHQTKRALRKALNRPRITRFVSNPSLYSYDEDSEIQVWFTFPPALSSTPRLIPRDPGEDARQPANWVPYNGRQVRWEPGEDAPASIPSDAPPGSEWVPTTGEGDAPRHWVLLPPDLLPHTAREPETATNTFDLPFRPPSVGDQFGDLVIWKDHQWLWDGVTWRVEGTPPPSVGAREGQETLWLGEPWIWHNGEWVPVVTATPRPSRRHRWQDNQWVLGAGPMLPAPGLASDDDLREGILDDLSGEIEAAGGDEGLDRLYQYTDTLDGEDFEGVDDLDSYLEEHSFPEELQEPVQWIQARRGTRPRRFSTRVKAGIGAGIIAVLIVVAVSLITSGDPTDQAVADSQPDVPSGASVDQPSSDVDPAADPETDVGDSASQDDQPTVDEEPASGDAEPADTVVTADDTPIEVEPTAWLQTATGRQYAFVALEFDDGFFPVIVIPTDPLDGTDCFGIQFGEGAAYVIGDCSLPIVGDIVDGLPFIATDTSGMWGLVPIPTDQVAIFLGDFDQGVVEGVCALNPPLIPPGAPFTYEGELFALPPDPGPEIDRPYILTTTCRF